MSWRREGQFSSPRPFHSEDHSNEVSLSLRSPDPAVRRRRAPGSLSTISTYRLYRKPGYSDPENPRTRVKLLARISVLTASSGVDENRSRLCLYFTDSLFSRAFPRKLTVAIFEHVLVARHSYANLYLYFTFTSNLNQMGLWIFRERRVGEKRAHCSRLIRNIMIKPSTNYVLTSLQFNPLFFFLPGKRKMCLSPRKVEKS